jgi:hypothetical protein
MQNLNSFFIKCCSVVTGPSIGCTTNLVTASDTDQCRRISLGGSKLVPPQRFSVVSSNAIAFLVPQPVLRLGKVLRCSQPIQRNRLGMILRNVSFAEIIQPAKHVLPVSAALP